MQYILKKLYKDRYADIRDYVVTDCIFANESIQVQFEDKIMTLTPEQLVKNKLSISKKKFKSGYKDSKDYHLYTYTFIEDSK